MTPWEAIANHPSLREIGVDDADQQNATAFAADLARFLAGMPVASPLARVVIRIAARELEDATRIAAGRAFPTVEAAAHATVALWPYLRELLPPEPPAGVGEARDPTSDDERAARLQAALEAGADQIAEAAAGAFTAAKAADQLESQVERLVPGAGWSVAPGRVDRALAERLDMACALIERLPALRALADAIGRIDRESRRSGDGLGGAEELVGVHLGGEVAEALPTELALLGDDDTEDLFYQRLLERRLLSLELIGQGLDGVSSNHRRGPAIACIDTSGSMRGEPEVLAKAFVLALARRLLPRNRALHLLLFGGPTDAIELRLRHGRGGLEDMLSFLSRSFDGGTDFDTPLERAVALLDERDLHHADIVVVTDGQGRASAWTTERVRHARHDRGVRVVSVVLGDADADGVAPFSDEVHLLTADSVRAQLDSIERAGNHLSAMTGQRHRGGDSGTSGHHSCTTGRSGSHPK